MNATTIHCVTGANGSSERLSVAKPPSGIVESAFPTASNGVRASSSPVSHTTRRAAIRASVSPM